MAARNDRVAAARLFKKWGLSDAEISKLLGLKATGELRRLLAQEEPQDPYRSTPQPQHVSKIEETITAVVDSLIMAARETERIGFRLEQSFEGMRTSAIETFTKMVETQELPFTEQELRDIQITTTVVNADIARIKGNGSQGN